MFASDVDAPINVREARTMRAFNPTNDVRITSGANLGRMRPCKRKARSGRTEILGVINCIGIIALRPPVIRCPRPFFICFFPRRSPFFFGFDPLVLFLFHPAHRRRQEFTQPAIDSRGTVQRLKRQSTTQYRLFRPVPQISGARLHNVWASHVDFNAAGGRLGGSDSGIASS